jgi:short-subunit dehydrogenase
MALRLQPLNEQVIVLTGASSGIGLVTARMAAKRGARLVLSARNEAALRQLTDEINSAGPQAAYAVADVGDEEQVRGIARVALERFGGFDTWINDAGIGIYGALTEVSTADHRRLFETNYWGTVYGSLEAARHLRQRQGPYAGTIINIGSEVSDRAVPLIGAYAASKHAVMGFTDALRMELEKEGAPVVVTLVKPSATDTPFAEHAQNYLEEEPTLPGPMYAPEVVAEAILHCCETPRRDFYAGGKARQQSLLGLLIPRLMDWMMEGQYFSKQKSGRPPNRADDALHRPTTGLQERGQSVGRTRETSVYTKAAMHPLLTGALVVGAGVAAAAVLGQLSTAGRRG